MEFEHTAAQEKTDQLAERTHLHLTKGKRHTIQY